MQSQKEIPLSRLFIHCGILGWCFEILYTSLRMLQRRNYRLQGNTSIWMFPIYGCAAFLRPLDKVMQHFRNNGFEVRREWCGLVFKW